MIGRIIKNPAFQSLASKLMAFYLVYSKKLTLLGLFYFSAPLPVEAIRAWDMAAICFFMDCLIFNAFKQYIFVNVSLKSLKSGENTSIFERKIGNVQKVRLNVSVKTKNKLILKMIKSMLSRDRIILKLKWSYDTWLAIDRMDRVLSMNPKTRFFAETDGICVDLFSPVSRDEEYAEIINTPLVMACDMGDKSEGHITYDIVNRVKNPLKRRLICLMASAWIDVNYADHKVKVV